MQPKTEVFEDGRLSLRALRKVTLPLLRREMEQEFILEISPSAKAEALALPGFVPAERYGSMRPMVNELGKVELCRVLLLPEDVFNERGGYRHTLTVRSVERCRLEFVPDTVEA